MKANVTERRSRLQFAGDGGPVSTREISTRVVAPVAPYSRAMPYSRIAVDMALSRKNLMPASVLLSPWPAMASRLFQAAQGQAARTSTEPVGLSGSRFR